MTAFGPALADAAAAAASACSPSIPSLGVDAGCSAWNGLLPEDAMRMLPVLGIGEPLGEEFPCALPHSKPGDRNAVIDPEGLGYQALYPTRHGWEWWTLAEVFRSRREGRRVKMSSEDESVRDPVAHSAWWLRLRRAADLVVSPDLVLPAGLSPAARVLLDGFALVFAANKGAESPFSRRFASALCDMPDTRTGRGIGELRSRGVLVQVRELEGPRPQGWRPTPLFRLAPGVQAGQEVRVGHESGPEKGEDSLDGGDA